MSKLEQLCEEYQEFLRKADQKALEILRERDNESAKWPMPLQLKPIYGSDGKTQIGEIAFKLDPSQPSGYAAS